ncbi:MAG TPA: hypothetical protein VGD43_12755 [Micromonospora sp.]
MQDAWRAYLELALGLTEASRKRAQTAVRRIVDQSGTTATQLQAMVEELLSTGLANREALTKLVRFEVDRALGVVGLATAEEVADLTARVRQLEQELREARRPTTLEAEPAAAASTSTVAKTVAKKAVAKKAVAKKTAAKKTTTGGAGPVETTGTAGVPEITRATAKKVDARRLPRPAKRTPARPVPPTTGEPA